MADSDKQSIDEGIKFVISKTQENCQLVKVLKSEVVAEEGQVLQTYLHNKVKDGMGKIGVVFVSGF